ncbi:MAG TPA: GNAT family N-acetyltransferase [Gammaproteobacteria bacterium]|nr:GNAT family N-acetyltransferase [Gammaproteobacteria bacterium]
MDALQIVDCDFERHGLQMLAIVNDAIEHTTWVYDYQPRTAQAMAAYIDARRSAGFPVIAALDDRQALIGFGTFGPFRHLPGYKYTVEHSVFVEKSARRRGIGAQLLTRLITLARDGEYHVMIGVIDSSNLASMVMHESFGFECCGTLSEVGYKHGRWLDAVFYQLVLETPSNPVEPPRMGGA